MREIKFRAWDKHKDEFHNWDKVSEDKFYRYTNNLKYVLQQYTGLKDKKGKEIYEGDILKYKDEASTFQIGELMFCDFKYCIIAVGGDDEGNQDLELHPDYIKDNEIEVIGNIYENQELLEEKG